MQARENKKKHARTPKLDSASLLKPEITQTEPVDLTAQQTKRRRGRLKCMGCLEICKRKPMQRLLQRS